MDWKKAIMIGASAGGLKALQNLLSYLPKDYPYPVMIVQHLLDGSGSYLADYLNEQSAVRVKEADEKEVVEGGTVYIAPAGYHLLMETDLTLSLSVDPKVNFSRPSIDVLFESAAYILENRCIGIVLTGANSDGSAGLRAIKSSGGLTIVQSPGSAEYNAMPLAAIEATEVDYILALDEIGRLLQSLAQRCYVKE